MISIYGTQQSFRDGIAYSSDMKCKLCSGHYFSYWVSPGKIDVWFFCNDCRVLARMLSPSEIEMRYTNGDVVEGAFL